MKATKREPGIRLHHGKWQVRYYATDGRRRASTFARKSDAVRFRDATRVDKFRGTWIDPRAGQVRFGVYAAEWFASTALLRAGTREKVAGHLRNHIGPRFEHLRVAEIEPIDVRAWISDLSSSPLAPATVAAIYRTFSSIMKTLEIDRVIARTPCLGVDLPRDDRREEMRFLDAHQIRRLADAIDRRHATLIYMAAYTGARWAELAGLRIERVNVFRATLEISETLAEINGRLITQGTKTGARRTITMPRFLAEMTGEHLAEFGNDSGYVFTSTEGKPLRRRNFYRRKYKPAVRAAGLDLSLRFHDLRHSHVALLVAQGAHIKEIADRLGHSSPTVTMRTYAHVLPSLEERLRDGLENTFREARMGT